jgi:hypothetical protein
MEIEWQNIVSITLNELDRFSEDKSCIMASLVLIDVLRNKGIKDAYPLTVKVRILNPAFTKRIITEPFPQTPELLAQWDDDGCHVVAIGYGESTATQWQAHLVVITPKGIKGKDALCDLAIKQADVPKWNIFLGPVLFGMRDSFLKGTEDFGVIINECRIIYKAFPNDQSFKQTPLWKNNLKRKLIVKEILKRL